MSGAADPYVLPNGTLRSKLGLTSQDELEKAETRITAAHAAVIEANLPKPPFTFDTLRSIHHELFQDLYAWAGEPRTGTLRKREFDHLPVQCNPLPTRRRSCHEHRRFSGSWPIRTSLQARHGQVSRRGRRRPSAS